MACTKVFGLPAVGKRARVLLPLIVAILLAACSGAPDADDIQPLLERQLRDNLHNVRSAVRTVGGDSAVDLMHAMGTPDPADMSVENVEILESRALEHGDYELRLRYEIVAGDQQRRIDTATVRVNAGDNGWRLLPERAR